MFENHISGESDCQSLLSIIDAVVAPLAQLSLACGVFPLADRFHFAIFGSEPHLHATAGRSLPFHTSPRNPK